jgi:hypothetical protein
MTTERTQVCGKFGCLAVYPEEDQKCPLCYEPSGLWEKRKALLLLEENMGDETAWTGVPNGSAT